MGFLECSDLDWIQTSNLLSRNQVRYSVAPRGRYWAANIKYYYTLTIIEIKKLAAQVFKLPLRSNLRLEAWNSAVLTRRKALSLLYIFLCNER